MDATIIVPLSGDADRALRCFQALAALPDEPRFRVVVVDDAAPGLDGVLALLDGDVDLIRLPRRGGLAVAAGAGLERAQGDVVVLLRDAADQLDPLRGSTCKQRIIGKFFFHNPSADCHPTQSGATL